MNALPIAPAMMAPPATPAQGSGTTDNSFQQELDGQTAVLSATTEPKAGDDGNTPTAPGTKSPDATSAAAESSTRPSQAEVSGTTLTTGDGQPTDTTTATQAGATQAGATTGDTSPDGEADEQTLTDDITMALLLASQIAPIPLSLPLALEMTGQAEGSLSADNGTVSQGTAGQAVLQMLENLLARTETTPVATPAQLQGQNPEQATIPVAVTSALVTEDSATPGQTTPATLFSNTDSETSSASTAAGQTNPVVVPAPSPTPVAAASQNPADIRDAGTTANKQGSAATIAGKTVEILAMTQTTLQVTDPGLAPETEAQATTTTVSLRQDVLAQSLQTQLTASLTQQETEDAGAQTGNGDKQQSQTDAMLAAAEEALPATEEGAAPDNGSLFRSMLEAGFKSDAVSVPPSAMKPSTGFTVSEDHLLQQVLDRFALNRQIESGSISLRLHPAELGELKLDVLVQRSTVQLQVTAQNPQVQEMLEQNMSRLREALAQHGFSLDRMEVTLGGNSQEELLRQDGDNGSRYPSFSSSTAVSDWNLHTDEAAETGIFLTENNTSAGLNIHI
ncbi:MAG: hypothetical protein BWK76_02275 [Desulfobulbaceae bacterium A2]|nr:MAG: hypothetical protein BWK76_02275 [Desulfobulbaceae bacterium A2]